MIEQGVNMSSGLLVSRPQMVAVGVIPSSPLTQEEHQQQVLAPSAPTIGMYKLLTMVDAMEYARHLSSEQLTPAVAAQAVSPSEQRLLAIAPEMLLLAYEENRVGHLSGLW